MTSTDIVRRSDSLSDKVTYAAKLAESGLLPQAYRKQPANVLYATEYGDMLGLAPMAAITGIHVIEGKPTASAGLISALVRRAGHRLRISGNDEKAVAEITRCDDPEFTYRAEWTIARAKQANLTGKSVWKQYPAAMLKARAITEVARDACEEALMGMHYTAEELGAETDSEGTPLAATAERVATPAPQQPETPDWDGLITQAEGDPDRLRELYSMARGMAPNDHALAERIAAAGKAAKQAAQTAQEPASDVVDAEVVPDDETPQPEGADEKPTQGQLNKLHALLGDCGVTERVDKLATLSTLARRNIGSASELTKAEASTVIDAISPLAEGETPVESLDQVLAELREHDGGES